MTKRQSEKSARWQRGQTLTEAIIAMGALAALWWAMVATGTWQDDSVRTGLAARQAAFAYSRLDAGFPTDFSLDADARGNDVDIRIRFAPMLPDGLSADAQPGGTHAQATTLRRDWQAGESAVMAAHADVVASHRGRMGAALDDVPRFTRHTVVLRGAGHAGGDAQTQARMADSGLGWQTSAQASIAVGQTLAARMQPVDAAWVRPALTFEWLQKWTAMVPPQALQAGSHEEAP